MKVLGISGLVSHWELVLLARPSSDITLVKRPADILFLDREIHFHGSRLTGELIARPCLLGFYAITCRGSFNGRLFNYLNLGK